MKRRHQLKKQAIWLMVLGTSCIAFTLLSRNFFHHMDIDDFLKGLGVAFILSALFVQRKLERKAGH